MDATIDNRDQKPRLDPMIGTMLPRRYRITGSLGRGAMSVVYSGIYEPLGQPVAIKLLKSHLVSDQSTFKRFQQEAKTAGALEHPNVVGILDFGITDQGVPYLIMELLNGMSLWERLRTAPGLDLQGLLHLFVQICDALQYTHERGVIHRDVKPSNIIIANEDGQDIVKIVDFGIAKMQTLEGNPMVSDLTATGEVFGTPLYVSPEQAMGRTLDNRADIYSLGCVLYEAVAGQPVFNAQTAFDIIRLQINSEPIPLDAARPDLRLPPSLIRAVERSLQKSPNDRYQSMAELADDLRLAMAEDCRGMYGRQQKQGGINSTSRLKVAAAAAVATVAAQQAPPAVAAPKRRFPIMMFLLVWVSGMLTGLVILFSLDLKEKLAVASVRTDQMVVSERHPGVVQTDELARASQAITDQQFGVAEDALAKVIPTLERGGAAQQDNLANALNLMGIAHYYSRSPVKAEPYLRRAYDIDKSLYGAESAACAGVLTNLARVAEMEQSFDNAEKYYRHSLAISEKIYGRNDKKLGSRIQNLAAFLKRRHKNVEAASLERRALEMRIDK